MPISLKTAALLFSIGFFIIFILMVRKKSIKPFYSTMWLLISLFLMSVVVFESSFKHFATAIGLSDASFLVVMILIAYLLIHLLSLTIKVSEHADKIQELISYTSILENKIRKNERV